jgi:hypothetical protein
MASSEPSSRLRFSFLDVGVSAIAELDQSRASRTVSGILEALPIEADSFHGIYSGSEVACFINPEIWLSTENATSRVLPGEIGYYRQLGGQTYGFPDDLAEICWYYDRDAVPSTPDGPVAVNVFGRFTDGWPEFASICRQMRTSGARPILIEPT